jgi:hypothetical protein
MYMHVVGRSVERKEKRDAGNRTTDIVNDEHWILHECHLMWHKLCTPWQLADTLRFRMVGAGIMIDECRG